MIHDTDIGGADLTAIDIIMITQLWFRKGAHTRPALRLESMSSHAVTIDHVPCPVSVQIYYSATN